MYPLYILHVGLTVLSKMRPYGYPNLLVYLVTEACVTDSYQCQSVDPVTSGTTYTWILTAAYCNQ